MESKNVVKKVDDRVDLLKKLNKSTCIPRLRIDELDIVRMTTKFSEALLTTLNYEDRFHVFFPKRYCITFTDDA